MTKRKSKSPKEILSPFDEAAHAKKSDDESSMNIFPVLDTTPPREESTAHEPERADDAVSQPPVPSPQTPSWTQAEAAQSKQLEADIAMKAGHSQALWQQMRGQTKNKLFTPKPSVSTTRQKTMMILVPILLVVLIFILIQISLAPMVTGGGSVNLAVKGILYNEDNPSAIVNNQIVYEGDKISGATIIKINKDSVEFEVKKMWPIKTRRFTKKVRH